MKRLRGRVLLLAAVACVAAVSRAPPSHGGDTFDGRQFYSGEELYDWCRSPDPIDRRACDAYVCSLIDAWLPSDDEDPKIPYHICNKRGIACSRLGEVVSRYLEEHPAERRTPAAEVAGYALQQAFPCR